MPSNFTKQPQIINNTAGTKLNDGLGDSVIGGLLTGVPAGLNISQGNQTLPGDRMVLGEEDAAALTDTVVGTLFGGLFMYVRTPSGSTATPTINRALFWDTSVANSQFQATPDESGTTGVSQFAGVNINTLTKGNAWWIQQGGRCNLKFRATITGTATIGAGVYNAGAGAGADVGSFDQLTAGGAATLANVDSMLVRYVGVAHVLPVNNTATNVILAFNRSYRW